MELGMIGLGRMGANMVVRLLRGGHRVVAYDVRPEAVREVEGQGAVAAESLAELAAQLTPPRAAWVMTPAGEVTERTIAAVCGALSPGDIIIDGGNANYKDSMRRAAMLQERGIAFLDAGTSGGVWGLTEGYSLMVGGDKEAFSIVEPIFRTLAPGPDSGYGHVGPAGAGHFAKMVHNGIEYAMMQAYAEGFELMKAKEDFALDLGQVAEIWRHGSVVRSWLLDLTAEALHNDPAMEGLAPYVEDSGEGRWTVNEAVDLGVPTPTIALALQMRFRSRQDDSYGAKLLAAMRNQFGGHAVRRSA